MRGQASLFMIIGVVLVMLFSFAWYVVSYSGGGMPADQQTVHDFVVSCLSDVGEDGLIALGRQGRLDHDLMYEPLYLAYYYTNGPRVPGARTLEVELGRYVDERLDACVNEFEDFPYLQFTYIGAPDTSVNIGRKDVSFGLQYDLTFQKVNVRYTLDEFRTDVDVPLGEMHEIIEHLIDYYDSNGALDLSYDIPSYYDVNVHKHNTTMVVSLLDADHQLRGFPYEFNFAVG